VIIQPIVEGHGDVSAVPVLLRRICYELGCWLGAQVAPPMRVPRSKMVQKEQLLRYLRIANAQPGCTLILVIMDADDDCARDLAQLIMPWVAECALGARCELVVIPREYECWLIASLESLRGIRGILPEAISHGSPETVRDAKGVLTDCMEGGAVYHESADQVALTQSVDLNMVRAKCRSFQRLVDKIARLGGQLAVEG